MNRADIVIRFMSGIYGFTKEQAALIADWVIEDRKRQKPVMSAEEIIAILNSYPSYYFTTLSGTKDVAQAIHTKLNGGKE